MSENMDKHMDKTAIKADMLKQVGTEVGVTDWVLIDQQRIQDFADATLDQQWIHTDPDKAAKLRNRMTVLQTGLEEVYERMCVWRDFRISDRTPY